MAGNPELGAEVKAPALGWCARRVETREREAKRIPKQFVRYLVTELYTGCFPWLFSINLDPGPGQAVAGLVLAVFGGRAGVSRLDEILVVPREKTPTGAAARGNP